MKKRIKNAKKSFKDFIHNFFKVVRRSEMVILPGNIAFFLCLSIIPALGLITYAASNLNLSVAYLYDFLSGLFSKDIANLVLGSNLSNSAGIHFFIAIIAGFYVASNGADSIIIASNTIYGIENKSWFKRRIKAIGLSLLLVILILFILFVPVFGDIIINLVKEVNINARIASQIINIFGLLKGPLSWIFIFIIIRLIYVIAPDKKQKGRVINYGAIFTTIMWIIVTKIYSIYVTNYAEYSYLYGGLASMVVLMIWIYFLSYIFTIGIALNCEKDDDLSKTGTIKKF